MIPETSGTVDFVVAGQTCQTWYKIFGDLKSSEKRPVVALHGGPGMSHHYMLPHKELFIKANIPVVFYDQIGNGQSTHLRDAPKERWTPELFMDELENLLQKLGIAEDFDLLGNSWGGMLAGHYAASRTPKGLKRLVLANSPASIELFEAGTNALLNQFPEPFVKMIREHEEKGTTGSKEYQDGTTEFYKKHICTTDPWPTTLLQSFAAVEENPTVYSTMLGPSEFCITGTMKNWTIVDILCNITCPTLLISSPNDEVQLPSVLPFFQHVKKIKWVELQNSTHLAMYEEPERYFEVLLEFLDNA